MAKVKPQLSRLIFIDQLIRKGAYPNCSSIAREYEVSSRTIMRDIEYMRDMHEAPIEYDHSKRGYYYTEPNYYLKAIDIKESDLFAICIAEKALEQYANTPIYNTLATVFDKIRAFLPETITVNTSWADNHYTFMRESATVIKPEVWETVSQSLRTHTQLRILHQKAGAEKPASRTVDPYHIVNYRGDWYLIGFCHLRNAILRFAISRIKKAELTNRTFSIPDDFDFESYMGSHFGIMTDEEEYAVKIRFSADQAPYVTERTWHSQQQIAQNSDGSIVLSFPTNSLFEVKRWILSWGADAKVLEPAFLVEQVEDELRRAMELYR